jgi:hypothetical protein
MDVRSMMPKVTGLQDAQHITDISMMVKIML